jgi:hypothetical protein
VDRWSVLGGEALEAAGRADVDRLDEILEEREVLLGRLATADIREISADARSHLVEKETQLQHELEALTRRLRCEVQAATVRGKAIRRYETVDRTPGD